MDGGFIGWWHGVYSEPPDYNWDLNIGNPMTWVAAQYTLDRVYDDSESMGHPVVMQS